MQMKNTNERKKVPATAARQLHHLRQLFFSLSLFSSFLFLFLSAQYFARIAVSTHTSPVLLSLSPFSASCSGFHIIDHQVIRAVSVTSSPYTWLTNRVFTRAKRGEKEKEQSCPTMKG